ncbi:MAG: hypothetical protein A3H96_19650 [Acidobacteria bacterium RIFCSPLOWO2_02_FULL_67_36]|nr:MAG: hypothetical protein A3H96_19650 [Acidobacteria bacterium RIFCSPLOWO2_02_FULL_67_36]OFW23746.1 MAG: hypothetical protein A3G21_20415 [Acidobacteria bacterium RIFCSPLOWO2_12_FULL_66_21]
MKIIPFGALALALLGQTAVQSPPAPDPRTGLIVGQVVDAATGKPLSGAIVSIGGEFLFPATGPRPTPPPRILTGSDGYFVFRDLPRGSFTISAYKSGYADGATGRRRPGGPSQPIEIKPGGRVGDVMVKMWRVASISGTVVDEAGEAIVGVQIRAFRRSVVEGRRRFVSASTAMSDDRGIYRLGDLIPGDYVVAATAQPITAPVMMTGSAFGQPAYAIGRGIPVPPPSKGQAVFVYPPTFSPSGPLDQATIVPLGSGEERTAVDIALHPIRGVRVSGVVTGPDGPAASMQLQMLASGNEAVSLEQDAPSAISDQTGAFTFFAVASGDYTIRVAARSRTPGAQTALPSVLWAATPLSVGRTDIDGVVVSLQRGLRVTGRFEFDGAMEKPAAQRLAQVPVVVDAADGPASISGGAGPSRVDASGQFTTADVPPGKYFVRIGGSPQGWMFKSAMYNGRDVADTPFDLRGGDATGLVITFTDRWSGMRGMVQSADGPDPDATVLVFPVDEQMWSAFGMNPRRIRSVRTSATGEYNFPSLLPGDYYAVAVHDDQAADWRETKFMESLARLATRVSIGDGEKKTQDLHTRDVR